MKQEDNHNNTFGMIGLGTMGANLLQNITVQVYSCAGYDKSVDKVNSLIP